MDQYRLLGCSVTGQENPVESKGCHVVTIYLLHCVFVFIFLEMATFSAHFISQGKSFPVNIKNVFFFKNYFIYVKVIYNYNYLTFYCSRHVTFGQRYTYKPNPQAERNILAYVQSMLSKMLGSPALEDQKVNTIQYV